MHKMIHKNEEAPLIGQVGQINKIHVPFNNF